MHSRPKMIPTTWTILIRPVWTDITLVIEQAKKIQLCLWLIVFLYHLNWVFRSICETTLIPVWVTKNQIKTRLTKQRGNAVERKILTWMAHFSPLWCLPPPFSWWVEILRRVHSSDSDDVELMLITCCSSVSYGGMWIVSIYSESCHKPQIIKIVTTVPLMVQHPSHAVNMKVKVPPQEVMYWCVGWWFTG